jgi:hypothetical protein
VSECDVMMRHKRKDMLSGGDMPVACMSVALGIKLLAKERKKQSVTR